MKYDISIKKNILGFKPELHWKIIVISSIVLSLVAVIFDTYLYSYAKDQISKEKIATTSSSTVDNENIDKLKSYTSSSKMEELFDLYEKRNIKYNSIINSMNSTDLKNINTVGTTTSSSTSLDIATSSK